MINDPHVLLAILVVVALLWLRHRVGYDRVMHIVPSTDGAFHEMGRSIAPTSLCSKPIIRGARRRAPLCQDCFRLSGWVDDRRRHRGGWRLGRRGHLDQRGAW